MKKYKLLLSALLSVSLTAALVACSSGPTNHTDGAVANAVQPASTIASSQPTAEPTISLQPSASRPPIVHPGPKPLYRMNDAYRFVPIEESAIAKAVLLTFDDGPNNEKIIVSLLDTLDKHKAKAIFFVNGYRVKQNPELLRLIYDRGGTIGNHAWDHNNLKEAAKDVVKQQIGDVQDEVKQLTGVAPLFFRPPYGAGSDIVKQTAKDHGMLYMKWSNGSLDWEKPARDNPAEIVRNVMEQLHPGANILMHELQWTADALDELLTKLEKEGYSFIDPATIATTPYT
ncbi:polysaccharide deacetylase family protein [Paenibacillus harenae]|uniref:Peptidoglycan/xylan/chitin deacetylase (PgdA/CDA1 family) n=1 Tax=Paenibacillus harenae TaxID=306543 RepID=A0ABT9TZF7_PAEHA|nr:polysaccharide deacetylase family protein [Paenibacillus harenae]MDQ0111569.1 peptidoglycan/xylan/chitin deacetylase (PgdA/CDA1 family) [Paenibacillus harenae]